MCDRGLGKDVLDTTSESEKKGKLLSRVQLCNPMDCSPPGFSIRGIFQAWVLQWVAISFSRGSSQPRDWTWVSHIAGRRFTIWATRAYSWQKSYDQPTQHIKKQRHYFANKGPSSQVYGFSIGHVWMWVLDYKESWQQKNWCFWTVIWRRHLRIPWTARRAN